MTSERAEALGFSPPFEAIQVGPDTPTFLRLSDLNEMAQVRQSYDPDGIEDLARSMVRGEMPEGLQRAALSREEIGQRLVLLHPLAVGRFSSLDNAQRYLDDHADHYGIDIPRAAESLEQAADGFYYLLIAGHRRKRALQLLRDEFGIEDDVFKIATHVFDDVEFGEALGLQLRENVHDRPPAVEEARSIERYYNHLQKTGRFVSIKKLANQLGMGPAKVSAALAFAGLPEDVKALAIGDKSPLSYSVVSKLRPLFDGYLQRYDMLHEADQHSEAERAKDAEERVLIVANKIISNKLNDGEAKAFKVITGHMDQLRQEAYAMDMLFAAPDNESPRALRTQQDQRIGETVLRVLEHFVQYERLTKHQRVRLLSMLNSLSIDSIDADPLPGVLTGATEASA
jgi:hypothetical protein